MNYLSVKLLVTVIASTLLYGCDSCSLAHFEMLRKGDMGHWNTPWVDVNSNGIRDDIDSLIQSSFADTATHRRAAEQYARAIQLQLMMDNYSKNSVRGSIDRMTDAVHCVFSVFPSGDSNLNPNYVADKIEFRTVNSRERWKKLWVLSSAAGGLSWEIPTHEACD